MGNTQPFNYSEAVSLKGKGNGWNVKLVRVEPLDRYVVLQMQTLLGSKVRKQLEDSTLTWLLNKRFRWCTPVSDWPKPTPACKASSVSCEQNKCLPLYSSPPRSVGPFLPAFLRKTICAPDRGQQRSVRNASLGLRALLCQSRHLQGWRTPPALSSSRVASLSHLTRPPTKTYGATFFLPLNAVIESSFFGEKD